ncbi:MAG: ribosomal subunit interface protein [Parcubacteria group bacterium CG10_big_fil_rev_8_21_14_0_10_35_15]|nr:MAG: ribosomal subunit interface protein [Parcubacteria group bacterium CG10_big_fil_rev_8_21_14_0_10_35_15]
MKINIKSTNLELTEAIRDYVQEKMDMLDKYLGNIDVINCDFEVALTTNHHLKGEIYRAEANIEVPGSLLRIDKTEKNLYKAIDKVKDHLAQMIVKHKEKQRER